MDCFELHIFFWYQLAEYEKSTDCLPMDFLSLLTLWIPPYLNRFAN